MSVWLSPVTLFGLLDWTPMPEDANAVADEEENPADVASQANS